MDEKYGTVANRLAVKSRERRDLLVRDVVGVLGVLAVFSTIAVVAYWRVERAQAVVNSAPVGELVSVEFLSTVTDDRTRIETTRGVYLVYGTFQAVKGGRLVREERANQDKLLCDESSKTCKKLVD